MADVTIKYNDITSEMSESGRKIIKTQKKYCTGDITVEYTKPSGGGDEFVFVNDTVTRLALNACKNSVMSPKKISLGACTTILGNNFTNCSELEILNLPACTSIADNSLAGCQVLRELYLLKSPDWAEGFRAGALSVVHLGSIGAGWGDNLQPSNFFKVSEFYNLTELIVYIDVTSGFEMDHITDIDSISQSAPPTATIQVFDSADGREIDFIASHEQGQIVYK